MNDTIFALSSAHGKSGVAVIRISGKIKPETLKPRVATLINLRDNNGRLIDQCIAIYFPAPNSFTGEDVIELHTHGAPAVIQAVFDFLAFRGARMAEPGEFSRRAFYNNKMDLTEIDGLAALLCAQTDKQRAFALKSMLGADSSHFENWRAQMIEISAYAAAMLDYAADDLPENIGEKLVERTQKLYDEIDAALSRAGAARVITGGFNIVLIGETNVGKSSLFNRLVGANRAIVSDIPGTTRDVVTATLDIDGYLVNLSDTAGIRESTDTIEKIGIERTHAEIENADLILRVETRNAKRETRKNEIIVINKCDLDSNTNRVSRFAYRVSALTGAGIDELLKLIKQKIHETLDGAEGDITINERTREQLIIARDELKYATEHTGDMFAEHIRFAADAVGRILGTIDASEIMDATFNQLCLGK